MSAEIRVVLVDDHALVRDGIRTLLQQMPNLKVVAEASNGTDALSVVNTHQPDLVLLDISLPGMNGFEVAENIRKSQPGTRILFLSMHEEPEYFIRGLKSGGSGYLIKSVDKTEFMEAIGKVMAGEKYISKEANERMLQSYAEDAPRSTTLPERVSLSRRELEVLRLVADGLINKEIADRLFISPRTVETHRVNIMKKLRANNTAELIKLAVSYRLLDE